MQISITAGFICLKWADQSPLQLVANAGIVLILKINLNYTKEYKGFEKITNCICLKA